jgi:hypothetical protein
VAEPEGSGFTPCQPLKTSKNQSFYKTAAGRENKCLATDKLKLEFQPKPAGRVPGSKFL